MLAAVGGRVSCCNFCNRQRNGLSPHRLTCRLPPLTSKRWAFCWRTRRRCRCRSGRDCGCGLWVGIWAAWLWFERLRLNKCVRTISWDVHAILRAGGCNVWDEAVTRTIIPCLIGTRPILPLAAIINNQYNNGRDRIRLRHHTGTAPSMPTLLCFWSRIFLTRN